MGLPDCTCLFGYDIVQCIVYYNDYIRENKDKGGKLHEVIFEDGCRN